MDLAAFSQPTFDAREWAEGVLAPEKREGTLRKSSLKEGDRLVRFASGFVEPSLPSSLPSSLPFLITVGETLEAFLASASMRLQLLAQDLNGELEKGLMELTASFPRALAELNRLDTAGRELKGELGHVLGQVEKGRREGGRKEGKKGKVRLQQI